MKTDISHDQYSQSIISVIIPVYNRSFILAKTLDSIVSQKGILFEILLIDDGSTDDSLNICNEYAARYSNIRVFHQENAGISKARNVGLDNARGEYICFHDDDDVLTPGALKKMYDAMIDNNVELVVGNFERVNVDGSFREPSYMPDWVKNRVITVDEYWEASFDKKGYFIFIVNWAKLFKRSIWENLRFPESVRRAEDEYVMADILAKCRRIYVMDHIVHRQTMTQGSITRKGFYIGALKSPESKLITTSKLVKNEQYEYAIRKWRWACGELLKYPQDAKTEEERKEAVRLYMWSCELGRELTKYMDPITKLKYIGYRMLFSLRKKFRWRL